MHRVGDQRESGRGVASRDGSEDCPARSCRERSGTLIERLERPTRCCHCGLTLTYAPSTVLSSFCPQQHRGWGRWGSSFVSITLSVHSSQYWGSTSGLGQLTQSTGK